MKKLISLVVLAVLALNGYGRQLSPTEALSRATVSHGPAKKSALNITASKPVFTMKRGAFTSLYVFDTANKGYVIVSADDCAMPLLGYSDTSTFDPDSIPSQLQWWLDFYSAEIQSRGQSPQSTTSTASQARPERAAIAPLTKSLWNQDAPYNDDCPLDNGKRSVTGCVATAMAQLMYYYKWPATGQGSESYKWAVGDTTLSLNFADITFDWDDMTDTYNKESTAAQRAAVAELMYACGVSVHMHYTSGESGAAPADIGHALRTYFKYSPNMSTPQRYFYGLIDWENLVYSQLEQGMPVLYNGQGSEGGHQFICDGYSSDGYFHFNWGWSGMSDGYYLLSALDPMEQGIGGNLTGFDYEQGIWLNAKPETASDSTSAISPLIYSYGNFGTTATGATELGKIVTFEASKDFFNMTNSTVKGKFGIGIINGTDTTYVAHAASTSLAFYGVAHSFSVTLPSDLAAGTYTVAPAFLSESTGEWTPILCSLSGVQSLTMTVADGKASFTSAEAASVELTSLTENTPFYFGKKFSVTANFINPGTKEYFGELMLALVNDSGKRVDNALMSEALNLEAGESATVDIYSDFPRVTNKTDTVAPGDYYLQVYEYMTGNILYTSPSKVSISEAPATTIEIESLTAESEETNANGKTNVNFSGIVKCTTGYFTGQLQVRVYKEGATATSAKAKTDYIFADLNQETGFTAEIVLPDAKNNEKYYAEIYWDNAQVGDEKYPFTINLTMSSVEEEISGSGIIISTPTAGTVRVESSRPIASASIFNISGTEVAHQDGTFGTNAIEMDCQGLPHGVYIVRAVDNSGVSSARKLIL